MDYFISRGDQQYGPYSLADLQRYVQQGNIALTDKARSEGMTDWVPVSQVIGNVSVPQPGGYPAPANPYAAPANPYGAQGPAGAYGNPSNPYGSAVPSPYGVQANPYGAPGAQGTPQNLPVGTISPPPNLHWALVLLFSIFSCGIFFWVWAILEAVWIRKIRPENNGLFFYIASAVAYYGGYFALLFMTLSHTELWSMVMLFHWIWRAAFLVPAIMGSFTMKAALEDYYNNEEPIGLQLSGAMTFFFAVFYFQYHFTRIREMKDQQLRQQQGAGPYPGQYYGR